MKPVSLKSSEWATSVVLAISEQLTEGRRNTWIYQSGKCLFKLRRCQAHLSKIDAIYSDIEAINPEQFPVKIGVVKGRPIEELFYSYYDGPLAQELFFDVDGFFEAAKSCVDFSLAVLGSAGILKNPPNSMNAIIKDLKRHRRHSGDSIADALLSMWQVAGKPVKEYRDCFTHFVALAGDHWQTAINIKCESGVTHARLFLPDNPSANRNVSFTYEQRIDARKLIEELVASLEKYVNDTLSIAATKRDIKDGLPVRLSKTQHSVAVGLW